MFLENFIIQHPRMRKNCLGFLKIEGLSGRIEWRNFIFDKF